MLAFGLRDRAASIFPALWDIDFCYDKTAAEGTVGPNGEPRQRAYFTDEAKHAAGVIGMAPQLAFDPPEVQAAVLLHELGHAVDALAPREDVEAVVGPLGRLAPEARADVIGGFLAGQAHPICYTADGWLQTLGAGIRRPRQLPP